MSNDETKSTAAAGPAFSEGLGLALEAARSAISEFRQQDDYLLAHGASLMSENSHEILHADTLRRIVAAVVAEERERCVQWLRENYQDHATIAGLCDAMATNPMMRADGGRDMPL